MEESRPHSVNSAFPPEGIYSKAAEVPVLSQTIRRDRIVEIPEIHVRQKIVPKIHVKEIVKTVPKVEVQWVEKIVEVPQVQVIEKVVEVPEIHTVEREVPRVEIREVIHHQPRYYVQKVQKFVQVPHIQYVEKFVEVPQIHHVIKYQTSYLTFQGVQDMFLNYLPAIIYTEKVQFVDVPVEKIIEVPKVEVRVVEKIRHVPGPVEVIDVPQYLEGPRMEIPMEVPVYYDVPQFVPTPGKVIKIEQEKRIEKVVEVPVPVHQENVRIVRCPKEVPVTVYKDVPTPVVVDKVVDVPVPNVITPVMQEQIIQGPPVYEQGTPRYVYEPPVWGDPVYENAN